jgi:hypothetical protein
MRGFDENDPKAMAAWARRMRDEMGGEDMGPEFDTMVEKMERGELSGDDFGGMDDGGFDDL